MKSSYVLVLMTSPRNVASDLVQKVLKKRLAACANIISTVVSHYWWKNRIEKSNESILLFKTRRSKLKPLISYAKKNHPYDIPEIIVLPIQGGLFAYLKWIENETA